MADYDTLARLLRGGDDVGSPLSSRHMVDAHEALDLTPQESSLYQRHLDNLWGPGGVNNPDGSRSTLYQMVFSDGGKFYSAPTVWDGKILPPREAMGRAAQYGLSNFPSYDSAEAADARYNALHGFMERDTADWFKAKALAKHFTQSSK